MDRGYFAKLDRYEAMLIDKVLTLQNWDEETLHYLMGDDKSLDEIRKELRGLRLNAGRIIIGDMIPKEKPDEKIESFYIPSEEILHFLLTVVPFNFKVGDEPCGRTLKEKLYCAYYDVQWIDSKPVGGTLPSEAED